MPLPPSHRNRRFQLQGGDQQNKESGSGSGAALMSSEAGTASRPAFAAGSAVFGTAAVFIAIGAIIRMRNKDNLRNYHIPETPEVGVDVNERTPMLA